MDSRKTKKKGSNKSIKITAAVIVLLGAIGISSVFIYRNHMKNEVSKWNDKVYPNTIIQGVDIGGKSKEEAKALLNDKFGSAIINKKLEVKAGDKSYTMDYSKLKAYYNIDEVANEAFNYGKTLELKEKYKIVNGTESKNIDLKFSYDPAYIKEFVENIAKNIDKNAKNAKLSFNGGNFSITDEVIGYKLDTEDLKNQIISNINGNVNESVVINAKVNEDKPKVTSEVLKKINGKISNFSTSYGTSSSERSYNIELATKAINGTVLLPGETFSYNDVVGERSKERGYKDASVIVADKIEPGVGGGICQVSSTLYQAVLRTGLKSVERANHSLPVGYMTKGLDATVAWGGIDYKFKNTYDFPIYIEGINVNRTLIFNIYGDSSINNRTYDIYSEILQTIEPKTQTIDDPNLFEGETRVESQAQQGYKVKSYRKTYENGKLINTEVLATDTYNAVNGVIKKGTKKK